MISDVVDLVNDPYNGPEEGVDFWVDEQGLIQVSDTRTAGLIMRTVNTSGNFTSQLVKIGQKGDSVLLGFDELLNIEPVYVARIGYKRDTQIEVKSDTSDKFFIYVNKKRLARTFKKLAQAKRYIKQLDKDLQQEATEPEAIEE